MYSKNLEYCRSYLLNSRDKKAERNMMIFERYLFSSLSFHEVGEEFDLSRERIRQIVSKAQRMCCYPIKKKTGIDVREKL